MTYDELMLFVVKQQKLARHVVTCYEAGAFGFHLHRRLEGLGIKNYVVQPRDCYERGNKKAFKSAAIRRVLGTGTFNSFLCARSSGPRFSAS
jgi:hypothetical protein